MEELSMTTGVYLLQLAIWTLLGAGDIYFAIYHYKDNHYFRFGFWAMMTVQAILSLAKLMFCV
jgi:hypothetical protein